MLFYPTAIGSEPQDPSLDSYLHWCRVMMGHSGANLVRPQLRARAIRTLNLLYSKALKLLAIMQRQLGTYSSVSSTARKLEDVARPGPALGPPQDPADAAKSQRPSLNRSVAAQGLSVHVRAGGIAE